MKVQIKLFQMKLMAIEVDIFGFWLGFIVFIIIIIIIKENYQTYSTSLQSVILSSNASITGCIWNNV